MSPVIRRVADVSRTAGQCSRAGRGTSVAYGIALVVIAEGSWASAAIPGGDRGSTLDYAFIMNSSALGSRLSDSGTTSPVALDAWVLSSLADPVTKRPASIEQFPHRDGVIDARVFLRHTHGYSAWAEGQIEWERWAEGDSCSEEHYRREIEYDRPTYRHFTLRGRILDCGGAAGSVREFLPEDVQFVSTDPWLQAPFANSPARRAAYSCLGRHLNFIGATAEFQPFISECFDWVHLRSMLDHVQVPDLVMMEARRVLKPGGRILVGLYVQGGKSGVTALDRKVKDLVKAGLGAIGLTRWKDHHVWHPTFKELNALIEDNGFTIEDTYWQPQWKDTVCYISARRS